MRSDWALSWLSLSLFCLSWYYQWLCTVCLTVGWHDFHWPRDSWRLAKVGKYSFWEFFHGGAYVSAWGLFKLGYTVWMSLGHDSCMWYGHVSWNAVAMVSGWGLDMFPGLAWGMLPGCDWDMTSDMAWDVAIFMIPLSFTKIWCFVDEMGTCQNCYLIILMLTW